MENLKLGQIINEEQQRDAIHIAVAPMTAAEKLFPGQHVSVIGVEAWASAGTPIGVVDPYLKADVKKGQRFWLFLYPGSITSLRHEWTHPALADTEAVRWLKQFAEGHSANYDELVKAAATGEGYCFGDTSGPEAFYQGSSEGETFWRHLEEVTGKQFNEMHRENTYFRCAC